MKRSFFRFVLTAASVLCVQAAAFAVTAPPQPTQIQSCGSTLLDLPTATTNCTYYWQTSASGTSTTIASGDRTVTAAGTYYVRTYDAYLMAWSTATTVSVGSIKTAPAVPTVTAGFKCGPGTVALSASSATSGATINWYLGSTLQLAGENNFTTPSLSATTTYTTKAVKDGCLSNGTDVIATIKPSPAELASQLILSTLATPNEFNLTQDMQASGVSSATYTWYTSADAVITTSPIYNPNSATGNVTFKVKALQNGCYSDFKTITSTRYATPPAPGVTQTQYCGYTRLSTTTVSGSTIYWQTTSSGVLTTNSASPYDVTTAGTYYLRAKDNATGTWSGATTVSVAPIKPSTATLNSQLALSTLSSPNEFNQTQDMQANGVTGGTYTWYTNADAVITTAATYNPNNSMDGVTYKVKANYSGCTSDFKTITSTRYATPPTPGVTQTQYCGYTRLSPTTASGSTIYWQTTSSGVLTTNSASPYDVTTAGTYYLRAKDNATGTWSGATTVSVAPIKPSTATLNSQLALSTLSSPNEFNQTQDMQANGVTGGTYTWYTNADAVITTAATYNPNNSMDGVTYKVKANYSGCTSDFKTITSTRYATPPTPGVTQTQYCGYTRLSPTTASGSTIYWQTTSSGVLTTNSASPYDVTTAGTYYLRAKDNTTGTWSGATTVSVAPIKTVPVANAGADKSICAGDSWTLTASGGTTYSWSPATGLSAANIANPVATPTATTTYTVTATTNGCSATDQIIVTVNTQPGAPNLNSPSFTCGTDPLNVNFSNAPNGSSVSWWINNNTTSYSGENVDMLIPLTGTNTIKATVDLNGCTATATKTVTRYEKPDMPTATDASRVDIGIVTLNATTTSGALVDWLKDNTVVGSNELSYSPLLSTTGVHTFEMIATKDGCASPPGTVTVTVTPLVFDASPSLINGGFSGLGTAAVPYLIDGEVNDKVLTITCNTAWQISQIPSWITCNTSSGNGNASVTLSFTANPQYNNRVGIIKINAGSQQIEKHFEQNTQIPSTLSIFISEYAHGSDNNRAIELYNNSTLPIDLSNLKLERDVNGNNGFILKLPLTGTLPAKQTYVIVDNLAVGQLAGNADLATESNVLDFDGDDQIQLTYKDIPIDRIGVAKVGTYFFGKNMTCIRSATANTMDPNSKDPQLSTNWTVFEPDYFSNLGEQQFSSAPAVFFSEYMEGTNSNKALEIYNSSNEVVNLSNFAIQKQTNGTGNYVGFTLSGALAPGMTYTIVHPLADKKTLLQKADLVTVGQVMDFDGNDPIRLLYKGQVIDAIQTTDQTYTSDKTIYRIETVEAPNTVFTPSEWVKLSSVDMEQLGYHTLYDNTVLEPTYTENFVITRTPTIPVKELTYDLPLSVVSTQIAYIDGLGRPDQEQALFASANGFDAVSFHEYDDYGRESTKNLPYIAESNGTYINDPKTDQLFYYSLSNTTSDLKGAARTDKPSSISVYDNSPLNRIVKQGAPGEDWQPNGSPDEHVMSSVYEVYSEDVNIKNWKVENNQLVLVAKYLANELLVSTTEDEDGLKISAYTNKDGQTIMTESIDGTELHRTYYVYDDFGLLRYMLPPQAEESFRAVAAGTTYTYNTDWVKAFGYYYEYDARKRLIMKQLPGVEPVYMVYDKRDRLVMSQDGNQFINDEWYFTKYDNFDRPLMTGIFTMPSTETDRMALRNTYQGHMDGATQFFETRTATFPGYTLTQTFPNSAPYNTIVADNLLTLNYYDDYTYPGVMPYNAAECIANNNATNSVETDATDWVTGTATKVLDGSNQWITETVYYNELGMPVYTTRSLPFGTETISARYGFTGNVQMTRQKQTFTVGTTQTTVLLDKNSYNHAGQLIQTDQKIDGKTGWQTLSQYEYNELGQMVTKKLGNGIQKVDYAYNIRGWLTHINNPDDASNPENDLFAMQLIYNKVGDMGFNTLDNKQFGGNIAAMIWKSPTVINNVISFETQAYKFKYDGLNRLKEAISGNFVYIPQVGDYAFIESNNNTVKNILYCKNGNITHLDRWGKTETANEQIDNLTYNYGLGNLLTGVTDATGNSSGFKAVGTSSQFTYDANGNLKSDINKMISGIGYNYLNLPEHISFSEPGMASTQGIDFVYTATGEKIAKIATFLVPSCPSCSNTYANRATYYFGGFEYNNSLDDENTFTLDNIQTAQSRIRVDDNYAYDYFLQDHLGNNRVVFTAENGMAAAKQVNNYDPFGMRFNNAPTLQIGGAGENNYLYNDKEYHNDFDLGWLEYGTRFYDPTLGRFGNVDLLAEIYHNQSPFAYAANNPINFIDFMGMSPEGDDKKPKLAGGNSGRGGTSNGRRLEIPWRDNSGDIQWDNLTMGNVGYQGYTGAGMGGGFNYDYFNDAGQWGMEGYYSGQNYGGELYSGINFLFSSMQHLDNSPQPMASMGNMAINMNQNFNSQGIAGNTSTDIEYFEWCRKSSGSITPNYKIEKFAFSIISGYYGFKIVGGIFKLLNYGKSDVEYYRGGNSFNLKPNEFKINNETGLVRTTHGVSINKDPSSLAKFGGAYKIDKLPNGLRIIQRGRDLNHYEIVPIKEMKLEDFQNLLNQIRTSPK